MLLLILVILILLLPTILHLLGLHPKYLKKYYNIKSKRALIITTSNSVLYPTKKPTGVYASELTIPYYEFIDANLDVDLCSIKGGKIPLDPFSVKYPLATKSDKRFLKDSQALNKLNNSLSIDNINILDYDIVFIAGGFGAAYDIGTSEVLGEKITIAYKNDILLGAVCHGVLGFRLAKDLNKPLVENKNITGVTNKQLQELKINITPLHPETELRKQNAIYHSSTKFKDVFANLVITEGNIVTGQNQNAGGEVAQILLEKLATATNR